MNTVSDELLLTTAQIAATLLGLLLVGVLFYAETGLRKLGSIAPQTAPYLQAGTIFVLLLYSLVLGVSLVLVAFGPPWSAIVFVLLGLALLVALVLFTRRTLDLSRARPDWLRAWWAWLPWPPTLITLGLPWLLGGLSPDRDAFVASIFIGGATAFQATAGLVLLTFEVATLDRDNDAP
jgi:hypothetical protein